MSTVMVHVLAAYKYNSDADVAFYVGSVAPDVIQDHVRKDHTHFRDRTDRVQALRELADSIDWENEFELGVLFHLFLDYYWDKGPICDHRAQYVGDNWFHDYRKEIGYVAVWHYYNEKWSEAVWKRMREYRLPVEETICEIKRDELEAFITKHHNRYIGTEPVQSTFFTPDMVEAFSNQVVKDFIQWRKELGR